MKKKIKNILIIFLTLIYTMAFFTYTEKYNKNINNNPKKLENRALVDKLGISLLEDGKEIGNFSQGEDGSSRRKYNCNII